jgi:hypothetical protein
MGDMATIVPIAREVAITDERSSKEADGELLRLVDAAAFIRVRVPSLAAVDAS